MLLICEFAFLSFTSLGLMNSFLCGFVMTRERFLDANSGFSFAGVGILTRSLEIWKN